MVALSLSYKGSKILRSFAKHIIRDNREKTIPSQIFMCCNLNSWRVLVLYLYRIVLYTKCIIIVNVQNFFVCQFNFEIFETIYSVKLSLKAVKHVADRGEKQLHPLRKFTP